jgi:prepilin-type N-terminal cleavage/methylation domain-containing protein
MRKESGFTLIELLIVLAILGILVGIVAMSVGDINQTAKQRGMQSEREIVQTAIDTFLTQDVTVGNAAVPGDQATAIQLDPADRDEEGLEFVKYLRRTTKYYYTWSDLGQTTQELIVWDGDSDNAVRYPPADED